jgi:Blastomyces yeast-phase-specific protein
MLTSLLAVASLAFAPLAIAGSARVTNNCDSEVTVWSVGGSIAGPWTLAANGGTYSEAFEKDPQSGGKAIKITKDPNGLYDGAPQTTFAYNLDGGNVWYDLSDVFGDAFSGAKLVEASADESCPSIVWDTGVPPNGSQVKVCEADADVTLTLCSA